MHTLSRRLTGKDTADDRSRRSNAHSGNNFQAPAANGDRGSIVHSHPAVPDIALGDGSEAYDHTGGAEAAQPHATNRSELHRAQDKHYHAKQEARRRYTFGRG